MKDFLEDFHKDENYAFWNESGMLDNLRQIHKLELCYLLNDAASIYCNMVPSNTNGKRCMLIEYINPILKHSNGIILLNNEEAIRMTESIIFTVIRQIFVRSDHKKINIPHLINWTNFVINKNWNSLQIAAERSYNRIDAEAEFCMWCSDAYAEFLNGQELKTEINFT